VEAEAYRLEEGLEKQEVAQYRGVEEQGCLVEGGESECLGWFPESNSHHILL